MECAGSALSQSHLQRLVDRYFVAHRTIYVDGKEVASDISGSAYLGTTGDTVIGVWLRPSKPPLYQVYHGAIDEVRVWHRLLEADEILLSMETKMAVDPQGKIATVWGAVKNSN